MMDGNGRDGRMWWIAAAILAAGILFGGAALGAFVHAAQKPERTVTVVGSASRAFRADVVKWRLSISRQVDEQSLQRGFAQLNEDVAALRAQLVAAGVPDSAITRQPPSAQPQYSPQGGRAGYNVVQPLYIVSTDIEQLESLALDPARILGAGAALEYSQLEYFYEGIAELKHALLADATRDAQRRAQEIAGSTGGSVGAMMTGRAGVFQITEPYSTEVASYGVHNTATRNKEITVTVHGQFRIR